MNYLIKRILHNVHRSLICRNYSLNHERHIKEGIDSNAGSVPDYVDLSLCPGWEADENDIKVIRSKLLSDMKIINDFINGEDEKRLLDELEPTLKKMRYEYDHWDDAIHGFKETEKRQWSRCEDIIQRAKHTALQPPEVPLPHTHVLDLDAKGFIKPHVDAVRFCGPTVAGICLLSPAVMRLRHTEKTDLFADFLLSRRCFYIMTRSARYQYTHEILKNELSTFKSKPVVKSRRISVITRSEPSQHQKD